MKLNLYVYCPPPPLVISYDFKVIIFEVGTSFSIKLRRNNKVFLDIRVFSREKLRFPPDNCSEVEVYVLEKFYKYGISQS